MRSNKFISMLAVAAVMVGCSQEELPVAGSQQLENNLANRPVVGNVEIGLGVESRMALKDGSALNIAYELGDKVGAALIDVAVAGTVNGTKTGYTGYSWTYDQYLANEDHRLPGAASAVYYTTAGLKAKDFYTTVEYISSNYPYTRNEDGSFESEANLLEGNYMFYMPYNAKHLNRKAIEAVLPQIQDCSDDVMRETTWKSNEKIQASSTTLSQFYAGTMEGFEGVPVLLGYKFLEAPKDGSLIKPSVEMNHLFAYPMITIKNDFNGFFYGTANQATAKTKATATMTVDSIQVYYTGTTATNPLFYKKPVNSANIATQLATDGEWEEAKLQTGGLTASVLGTETTATFNHANVGTDVTKLAAAQIAPNTKRVTMVLGKELAYGESYSFHSILPAGAYGDDLTARVYVTIDSKRYVIINAKNNVVKNADNTVNKYTSSNYADYKFISRGGNGLELVRGEHFPKAEINVDENGNKSRKAFAGEAMTISFAGTTDNSGNYTGGTAFELSTQTITNYYGITSNADFISYLNDWVGRGMTLTETTSNATVARVNWAEGAFAFHPQNTVVINAELIKGLKKHTDKGEGIAKLVLSSNMPIANDVKITAINTTTNVYTFETLDADKVSYMIKMTPASFYTNAADLKAGINVISGGELKTKSGQSNIVVILNGNSSVTANTTNVSAIYVESGILTVNAACSAMVVADESAVVAPATPDASITIGANGSLTNANNVLKNITVTNNSAREIAGTLTDDVTVAITYDAAWPTTAIPANSKINKVTINTATGINEMVIEQAQVDMFSALTNVKVVLGANITKIKSTTNVVLTNIKSIDATTAAQWYSTNNGVIITKYQWGTSTSNVTAVGNITAGAGITIQ